MGAWGEGQKRLEGQSRTGQIRNVFMHQGKVSVLILRAKEKHRKILNNTILLQLGESHDLELTATGLIFFTKGQPMECRSVMIMNQPFGPVT